MKALASQEKEYKSQAIQLHQDIEKEQQIETELRAKLEKLMIMQSNLTESFQTSKQNLEQIKREIEHENNGKISSQVNIQSSPL